MEVMDKKTIGLCKNIIAISLSLALLLFFAFSNSALTKARGENRTEGIDEIGTEAVLEESTEFQEKTENTGANDGTAGQTGTDETGTVDTDVPDDSNLGASGGEEGNSSEKTQSQEVTTVVATITYAYPDPDAVDVAAEDSTESTTEVNTLEDSKGEKTTEESSTENTKGETPTEDSLTEDLLTEDPVTEDPLTEDPLTEDNTPQIAMISETREYTSLTDAFAGASEVTALMEREHGISNYVPVIQLAEEVLQEETVVNTTDASFSLDFAGHFITLGENAYLDFRKGDIAFSDSEYLRGGVLGGIVGTGEYLLTGEGNDTFINGYFENQKEAAPKSILASAGTVTFEDGFYLAKGGSIVASAQTVAVNGGFYIYNYKLGLSVSGSLTLPQEKAMIKSEILLGEVTMTGYQLGEPNYVVTIDVLMDGEAETKQISAYTGSFVEAWNQAIQLSSENNSAIASIQIYNQDIAGVSVSQAYTMNEKQEESVPEVSLIGIGFTREGTYDGGMFDIGGGKLILDQCQINGTMETGNVAQGSLVKVQGTGTVTLIDTVIQNNCSLTPGAGVYVGGGCTLGILGDTTVSSNTLVAQAPEETIGEISPSNVYLEEQGRIEILGALTSTQGTIGVSHFDGTIAGLTRLGGLNQTYLTERLAALSDGENLNLSDVTKMIVSDNHPSYFLTFNQEENYLLWEKEKAYLPEAGMIRFEYVILILALAGFLFRNTKVVKESRGLGIYITTLSTLCLVFGGILGFYHLQLEKNSEYQNQTVITDMTAAEMQNVVENHVTTNRISKEQSVQTEATENAAKRPLMVPEDGREYFGIVEIPELSLKLPVLMEYTDANMKTTPCVYYGEEGSDDLVIVGHNYDNQFGPFNNLGGEAVSVILTLMDGRQISYESFAVEYLNPDQVDEMLMGEWDMTLFTCNYAGDKRIALRCNRKE